MANEQPQDLNALMVQMNNEGETMQLWSDDKKKDFCDTFSQRAEAARYIYYATAGRIAEIARKRRFIGLRKLSTLYKQTYGENFDYLFGEFKNVGGYGRPDRIGGRTLSDLNEIAEERAQKVLNELPIIKDAVKIIAPDVAKKMERRDELLEKGQKLLEDLGTLEEPLVLTDYKDKKVSQFLEDCKDLAKKRRKIIDQLNDVGEEGMELESQIDKALFRGLPGLDDAILEVCKEHVERAKGLDQFNRRVAEKVKFGDSAAALNLLQEFEKDEQKISKSIAISFSNALAKLQLAAKSGKKLAQLQGKKD